MCSINAISPYVRLAWDHDSKSRMIIRERVIFDYELLYVKRGNPVITIGEEVYHAQTGDIFVFKPNIRHSIMAYDDDGIWQPHIHFDLFYEENSPEVLVSFKPKEEFSEREIALIRGNDLDGRIMNLPGYIRLNDTTVFEEMLFTVIREYESKLPMHEISAKAHLILLLVYLARETHWADQNPEYNAAHILRVRDYLMANLHKAVTLDELMNKFNISKYHLIRSFRKMFHMSPIRYHRHFQMDRAKTMIQLLAYPISEVAGELGFESLSTFSRAFKNQYGYPPSYCYQTKKKQ